MLRAISKKHRGLFRLMIKLRMDWKFREILKNNPDLKVRGRIEPSHWERKFGASTKIREAYQQATGLESEDYIPEVVFYRDVEPFLNPIWRTERHLDKNLYDRLPLPFPETVARVMGGQLVGPDYKAIDEIRTEGEVVVKPSIETSGGVGVFFTEEVPVEELLKRPSHSRASDYIVQRPVRQVEELARINASSLNTIRLTTLRSGGEIIPLSAVLRMGLAGCRVDNQRAGGIAVGIDGTRLRERAFDKYFRSYTEHPTSGIVLGGYPIPWMPQVEKLCIRAHEIIPDINLISWDVAIEESGSPLLIEFNIIYQELNFHQLCNGPLFGPLSRQVAAATKPVPL